MAFSGTVAVRGMKEGDFQAVVYAGTEAGVTSALSANAGGEVRLGPGDWSLASAITVPDNTTLHLGPGTITLSGTGALILGNKSVLRGSGMYNTLITASATTNVTAIIQNRDQDGTQQSADVYDVGIYGNRGLGAIVGAGLLFKALYVGTRVGNVISRDCSGYGFKFDGGSSPVVGIGQLLIDNIIAVNCLDHNILFEGACDHIIGIQITSESPTISKAAMKITRNTSATASVRHQFFGIHMEGTAITDGVWLDECSGVLLDGVSYDGNAFNSVVKITGTTTGSDGAFAAAGHTIRNLQGASAVLIDDQVSGVTVNFVAGTNQSRFVDFYISPVGHATKANSQIIGIQAQRQGPDIASTASLTLGNGNFFSITGTADITSIETAARDKGRVVTLLFSGTASGTGLTDGSNLKIAGNFVYTPDDVIQLISNGTNWYQVGPGSVN